MVCALMYSGWYFKYSQSVTKTLATMPTSHNNKIPSKWLWLRPNFTCFWWWCHLAQNGRVAPPQGAGPWVKAHSHQARVRPSTSVARRASRASTCVDRRLRPSTDVNALKIEHGSILSASMPVHGRRRAWCERTCLLACVPYRRRRASTSVYVRRRASTRVNGRRQT